MNIKMHTGCGCMFCRHGRNAQVRREFHRKLRKRQKQELKNKGDIVTQNKSIGYTD